MDAWLAAKRAVLNKVLRQPDLGLAGDFLRHQDEWDIEQPYQEGSIAEMPNLDEENIRQLGKTVLTGGTRAVGRDSIRSLRTGQHKASLAQMENNPMTHKHIGVLALGAIAVLAVLLAGCSHRSVVGVWEVQGGPGPATFTFQADGNFKTEASLPGRNSTVTGQYEQKGDTLVFKTMNSRSATVRWNSNDEMVVTGDDGVAKTLKRKK